MTEGNERQGDVAGDIPAAAPDVAEVMEAEVIDAEVVEEDGSPQDGSPQDEPSNAPGMPGSEAEDMPVYSKTSDSPDDGPSLTSPEEGESPGAAELAAVTAQRDEYLQLAQRTHADFDNYRKRMTAEVKAAGTRSRVELATGLISVLDNLENALTHAGVDPAAALAGDVKPEGHLEQGVVLTYRELVNVLMRAGVQPYDPAGEPFDPTWHEALQTRPAEGIDSGTVVDVKQKGYRIDEQVIRAARVVVAE